MAKKFIAKKALFVGRIRAANPGDEVPESAIENNAWDVDDFEVFDVDDEAAPAPVQKSLDEMTAGELKDYAATHSIDLGDAKKVEEIRDVVKAAGGTS